jgi:type I restriction enzyme R subunit
MNAIAAVRREDSAWREILEYFSSATQIGLTATPKETEYVSNIEYLGSLFIPTR